MKIKPYIPDFKLAFKHFCIHVGGRAVLTGKGVTRIAVFLAIGW
ncbi:hypothetical protein Patl1_08092 [Pistacia atlantica]|uniref:Uncharacterized protein n=1 Tax=Pistacia atlantica TaxID=434234 RepID=A0ACC1AJ01_9ROSI|nr:hypothetical protein Patl1_08092 [Pistacia atlantica]